MESNIIQRIKNNWKLLLPILFLLIVLTVVVWYYESKPVPMATVSQLNYNELAQAMAKINVQSDAKKITETIIQREKLPPEIIYLTANQKQADTQADKLAKADKADFVLKNTTNDSGQIMNKYFGVHTEKNNKFKVGVTVTERNVYENIAYQHKKDELIVHMQIEKVQPIKGVTYMRTLAEW